MIDWAFGHAQALEKWQSEQVARPIATPARAPAAPEETWEDAQRPSPEQSSVSLIERNLDDVLSDHPGSDSDVEIVGKEIYDPGYPADAETTPEEINHTTQPDRQEPKKDSVTLSSPVSPSPNAEAATPALTVAASETQVENCLAALNAAAGETQQEVESETQQEVESETQREGESETQQEVESETQQEVERETQQEVKKGSSVTTQVSQTTKPALALCAKDELFDEVPSVDDKSAAQPVLGAPQLSKAAIKQRANRIFKPRCDGSLKVSKIVYDEWHSKGQKRRNLEQIFKSVGYDAERGSCCVILACYSVLGFAPSF